MATKGNDSDEQDAPRWRRGEAAMWRHLLAERVRLRDLR